MHRSGLALLQMPVDLHEQRDCDIPSAMMDFSDSDNSNDVPFIYQLQKGHRYRNLNTAPQSIPYYAAHDHATSHEDGISQNNSKPSWPGSKDASRSPPDLVLYQDSSSGTSQETEALSPPHRQYICEDMPHRVAEYTTNVLNRVVCLTTLTCFFFLTPSHASTISKLATKITAVWKNLKEYMTQKLPSTFLP